MHKQGKTWIGAKFNNFKMQFVEYSCGYGTAYICIIIYINWNERVLSISFNILVIQLAPKQHHVDSKSVDAFMLATVT